MVWDDTSDAFNLIAADSVNCHWVLINNDTVNMLKYLDSSTCFKGEFFNRLLCYPTNKTESVVCVVCILRYCFHM